MNDGERCTLLSRKKRGLSSFSYCIGIRGVPIESRRRVINEECRALMTFWKQLFYKISQRKCLRKQKEFHPSVSGNESGNKQQKENEEQILIERLAPKWPLDLSPSGFLRLTRASCTFQVRDEPLVFSPTLRIHVLPELELVELGGGKEGGGKSELGICSQWKADKNLCGSVRNLKLAFFKHCARKRKAKTEKAGRDKEHAIRWSKRGELAKGHGGKDKEIEKDHKLECRKLGGIITDRYLYDATVFSWPEFITEEGAEITTMWNIDRKIAVWRQNFDLVPILTHGDLISGRNCHKNEDSIQRKTSINLSPFLKQKGSYHGRNSKWAIK